MEINVDVDLEQDKDKNFDRNNENCIEWISGSHTATLTFTNRKHINRIKKLYESHKDDFKYFYENSDGSICCKIPLKWIKVNPGGNREYTEEQRAAMAERMRNTRNKMLNTNNMNDASDTD